MNWNLQHKSSLNTKKLYSHTYPSPGRPRLCEGPRPLIRLSTKLRKISQNTQTWVILTVKFYSVFMKLWVGDEKLNLLSWAIRLVFVDSVTFYGRNYLWSNKYDEWHELQYLFYREWFTQSCLSGQEALPVPITDDSMCKLLFLLLKESESIQVIASR